MSSRDSRARPELNPFAFPSDTTFRFVLLIVAVLGTSLFAFEQLYFGFHDTTDERRVWALCLQPSSSSAEIRACGEALSHALGAWILVGLGVLAVVALVIYLLLPYWRLRRRSLEVLSAEDAPEVVARLAELSVEAGLKTPPEFVWNPLNPAAGGLAFGRVGRRYIALGGGLVTMFYTDQAAFRAIVLHELAHLRNRDVDKTYFTMALWYSFVVVAVLPLPAALYNEHVRYIWSISWRLGALVVFVYLLRNAVLRSREVYADVRASQTEGGADGLRRVIGALPTPQWRRWRRLLSVHPDPKARVGAVLDDTDLLFRPGLGEAFSAGVVLTLIYGQLALLISFYDASLRGPYWLAALAVAPFSGGVVALGVWRGAFVSLARQAAICGVWRLGVALGAGFIAGEVLSLQTITTSGDSTIVPRTVSPEVRGVVSSAIFGPGIAWVVLAIVSLTLFVLWLDATAAIWLSRGGERMPRVALAAAIVAGGCVLTVWTGLFFLLHDLAFPTLPAGTRALEEIHEQVRNAFWVGPFFLFRFVWDGVGLVLGAYWPVIPTFALLWAFPVAAAATRGRRSWPSWAFLGSARPPAPKPERLQVSRAIVIGVTAGLVACAGVLALRAGIHASVGIEPPLTTAFYIGYWHWEFVLALVAQTVAASLAVLLCRRRPVIHGLLAGFAAGLVSTAGLLGAKTVGSCVTPLSLSSASCPQFVDGNTVHLDFDQALAPGSALALGASLVTYGVVWLVRHLRSAQTVAPAPVGG